MRIGLGVTLIVLAVNLFVFWQIDRHTNTLLQQELLDLSRVLHHEIVLVRSWVAHNGGVYISKVPGVEANPFLENSTAVSSSGDTLVLRNPAMITRELAKMTRNRDLPFIFHITSLRPLNPANQPDSFEAQALRNITDSRSRGHALTEVSAIVKDSQGTRFRYLAPLITEKDCLPCHRDQGYVAGDVRGGLSISIPMASVIAARRQSKAKSILTYLFVSGFIAALVYLFVQHTVVGPVRRLQADAARIGGGNYGTPVSITGQAEVKDLSRALDTMRQRIQESLERQIESEKLFALGQLAAGIAHDIRNPLFAVRNNLDFLQRKEPCDAQQTEVFSEMDDGLRRIDRIVREIAEFSQPRTVEFGKHAIGKVVESSMLLLRKQLEQKALEVSIEIDPHLPPLEIDQHRFEQVIINLVSNAISATRDTAHGQIIIKASRQGEEMELSVIDNGQGIREENLPRIFDPFFTRSPNGTGLGLTIVKRITLLHHGRVEVESHPGKGTIFTLWLPLQQPESEED